MHHTKKILVTLMLLAASLELAVGAPKATAPATVSLRIPSEPPAGHLIIDANYQSYSIEFSYMADYAGNKSQPNKFSYQLLKNLEDISGALPIIRAGGTTSNRVTYYPNQTEGVILTYYHGTWEDQPDVVSIGPKWHESFQQFPSGTKYIYNLNFYDGEEGLKQTVLEASASWKALGESVYAFEIGNEVNGWAGTSCRPTNWTLQKPRFQGCAFTAPRDLTVSREAWNVANAVREGMATGGHLRSVADHDYMGANTAPLPTLKDNLLNHFHMTSLFRYHEALGNQSKALGVDYVIGETNSISKQGTANVSDVFGAALWSVDYILYSAGTNYGPLEALVSRMYFHMGTPYRYSAWQPITVNNTAPYAKPLYYGNIFISKVLAGGNKQVINLLNSTSLTAYRIYASSSSKYTLESVAIINSQEFNRTTLADKREYTAFKLLKLDRNYDWDTAKVRRLTAPGVDSKEEITFAGQYVDMAGRIVETERVERVSGSEVLVGAGEGVLVTL
ncbi:uncharacterized protein BDR25DRAFT_321643 [Lindgomyces ingoldianus]|uniref:Uncharacterized protein n=1 Tax=Lindgomyces ingoldianus TaxID=673940 RepID=A0ACB6RDE3_9PLEO|nr:uncharacterized protein BDR25DRAFT_321643 [Lindgomyces ingoldianus]KAF2477211.1 hypothetical protein BDR25DRAFT_321643 [Lindgomyces ingoldianus]